MHMGGGNPMKQHLFGMILYSLLLRATAADYLGFYFQGLQYDAEILLDQDMSIKRKT